MSGIINATNLEVANIKDSTGTNTAMTVNSNGTMTPSKMVYASFRTSVNTTYSAQELITNWEAMPSPSTTLGASMTHSSGIFTFPHTGKFLIRVKFHSTANGGNRAYSGGSIQYSSNSGTSYSKLTRTLNDQAADGNWSTAFAEALIEITDVSTQRIAFHVYFNGSTILSTDDSGTMCIFQQVG